MKKNFSVNKDFIDSRLDKWFKRNVFDVPQSLIEKSLRKGNIKINSKKVKSSYKLKENDLITVSNLNFTQKQSKKKNFIYKATRKEVTYSSKMIIENNDNFVVINKPAGVAVQSGTKSKRNIIDLLRGTIQMWGARTELIRFLPELSSPPIALQ